MKSGKQRRAELDVRKKARATKTALKRAQAIGERAIARSVPVNRQALMPHNSYGEPEFVTRGFYLDTPFECMDCGKAEVWTAAQQKWWYEVAKGYVFTTARRCRVCRGRERQRRAEARRVHLEGLGRRRDNPA
jgi:hypothetical protein